MLTCIVAGTAERAAVVGAAVQYEEQLESPKRIAQEQPDIETEVVARAAGEPVDRFVAVVEVAVDSQPQGYKLVSAVETAVEQLIDRFVEKYKLGVVAVAPTSAVVETLPHIVVAAFEQTLRFLDEHRQVVAAYPVVRRIAAENISLADKLVDWDLTVASTHLKPGKHLG